MRHGRGSRASHASGRNTVTHRHVAVLGTGSWGTVFAKLLELNGQKVKLWGSDPSVISGIATTRRNPKFQPELLLSSLIEATSDPADALSNAQLVVLAVPAQRLRANLENWSALIPEDAIVLSLIKGLEHDSGLRVSQVVSEFVSNKFAVLSGPNLATEIAAGQLAAATVAATELSAARLIQETCSSNNFKIYRTDDVVGVEIAGTIKNIISLATGIVIGLGYGENAQAAMLTRGLAEMVAIGVAAGGKPETFLGLAGIGDLIATSQSPHSRNRSFGVLLGEGLGISEATAQIGQTVEAMKSTDPILAMARKHGLELPIISHVAEILNGKKPARSILEVFDSIDHRDEQY